MSCFPSSTRKARSLVSILDLSHDGCPTTEDEDDILHAGLFPELPRTFGVTRIMSVESKRSCSYADEDRVDSCKTPQSTLCLRLAASNDVDPRKVDLAFSQMSETK